VTLAVTTLGDGVEIDRDPPGGGVLARRGQALVDLTLPTLVERAAND